MKNDIRKQAVEVFLKAASYIRQYGWQEKGMGTDGQPRCSMGALASAYPKTIWDKNLAIIMYKSLHKELNGMTLTEFNHRVNDGNKVALLYERVANSLMN